MNIPTGVRVLSLPISSPREVSSGLATWGQECFRQSLQRDKGTGWCRNAVLDLPLEKGSSIERVLQRLSSLVSSFDSLRTRLQQRPDGLLQDCRGSGELTVELVEGGADGGAVRQALDERLRFRELGNGVEFPVAASVILVNNQPSSVYLAVAHSVADGTSGQVVIKAWCSGVPSGTHQPLEQAQDELDDGLKFASKRSVQAWLAAAESGGLPLATRMTGEDDDYALLLRSRSASDDLQLASNRLVVSTSTLIIGVLAAILSNWHGWRPLPLQLISANRHAANAAGYVGVLAQPAPLTVRLEAKLPVSALMHEVGRRTLAAHRLARWRPAELQQTLAMAGGDADDVVGATYTVSDVRGLPVATALRASAAPLDDDDVILPLPWWPYHGGRFAIAIGGDDHYLELAVRGHSAFVAASTARELVMSFRSTLRLLAVGSLDLSHELAGAV